MEKFIEQQYQQAIDAITDNLDFGDSLVYSEPTFVDWLKDNDINETDIQCVLDLFEVNDYIKTEHAGGFYTVTNNKFIVMHIEEFEEQLGEWLNAEELQAINEEFTIQGDFYYIYNPTAWFITIDDIKSFLAEQED